MQDTQKRRLQGIGAVFASGTGYAFMSILVKWAYSLNIGPVQVIVLQSWIASILLLVYTILFRRDVFKVSRRTLGFLVIQGVVGAMGTSLFYLYALEFLPVSVAILIMYLYPAIVLIAGVVIWRRKVGRQELAAFLLTLSGTSLASGIFSGVGGVALLGIVLGLAGAVSYAVFNLLGEVALNEVSPLTAMCFSQWFCSLALVVVLKGDVGSIAWGSLLTWEMGLTLATFCSIIPFYMILLGIERLGSDQAAILSTFELPMTFIMAAVFLQEFPTWTQWTGGALVMSGIFLLNWRRAG